MLIPESVEVPAIELPESDTVPFDGDVTIFMVSPEGPSGSVSFARTLNELPEELEIMVYVLYTAEGAMLLTVTYMYESSVRALVSEIRYLITAVPEKAAFGVKSTFPDEITAVPTWLPV
jgi:hypothetical protein